MRPPTLASLVRVSLLIALISTAAGNTARASDDGRWGAFFVPSPRHGHTMVYDSHHDRLILFGGAYFGAAYHTRDARSDVWVLEGDGSQGWKLLVPNGTPPPALEQHVAIYDPVRRRMIVHGGAELWELRLAGVPTWARLDATGGPIRHSHVAIYDPVGDRMIIHGGWNETSTLTAGVWALDLDGPPQWLLLKTFGTAPPARSNHTAVYDPLRHRMVVQGGIWEWGRIWYLDLSSRMWSYHEPGISQAALHKSGAIHDPLRDRMVLSNGEWNPYEIWTFALGSADQWQQTTTEGSELRYDLTLTRDPVRDRMISFGGYYAEIRDWMIYARKTQALGLDGATMWQTIGPAVPFSDPKSMVVDPGNDRLILLTAKGGGTLTLAEPPVWTPLAFPLPVGGGHAAIRDAANARLVAFGGSHNQVWSLSLNATPAWTEIFPAGTAPSARTDPTAIYDAPRERMIVFGGYAAGTFTNEVWSLTLGSSPTWTLLTPLGTPPPGRHMHGAIYDPAGARMIVVGGGNSSTLYNDVWALSLSGTPQWTQLASSGTAPPARYGSVVVRDDSRNRLLLFGGAGTAHTSLRDVWALSLTSAPEWTQLAPAGDLPMARSGAKGIYDPARDRMIVYGGLLFSGSYYGNSETSTDFQQLSFAAPVVAVPDPPAGDARLELLRPTPNPATTAVDVRFRASTAVATRVAIYDLAGRRVRTLFEGAVEAGERRLRWDLADAGGHRVRAGIYLCALEAGGSRSSHRVIVLP